MIYDLIPTEIVKKITGATTDEEAVTQGRAVVGMVQAYLGLVLVKQNFHKEKITVPYAFSRVLKPKYAPINSVSDLGIITNNGTYKADKKHLAIGEWTFEILPTFWAAFHYSVLPSAVSAVEVCYNAGLYESWAEVPGILQEAMQELLKYKYDEDYRAGFQSEHLGDYSYTKGAIIRGIPAEIAGMLEGLNL